MDWWEGEVKGKKEKITPCMLILFETSYLSLKRLLQNVELRWLFTPRVLQFMSLRHNMAI